jgi:hypothetical protein
LGRENNNQLLSVAVPLGHLSMGKPEKEVVHNRTASGMGGPIDSALKTLHGKLRREGL